MFKGVSFIPELDWRNVSKGEVKKTVENFLLKIENLPRIEIIAEYHNFYGDRIRDYS